MPTDTNQIPTVKYGGESSPPIQTDPVAASPATSQPQYSEPITTSTAKVKGQWVGDKWVEPSGYTVARKWVEKYPALFGPMAMDPDGGQGEIECDDAIARLTAKFTGYGGTFSTWAERHCFIIAAGIGYNDVTSSADVPPVPEFFISEMQYWISGITMGRAAKKIEDAAPSLKTYTAIFAGGAIAGNIPQLLRLVGVNV